MNMFECVVYNKETEERYTQYEQARNVAQAIAIVHANTHNCIVVRAHACIGVEVCYV